MNLIEYPDSELMAMRLADTLASELNAALNQSDRVTLAVPGGTTPGPVFDALSAVHLAWERVDVMLTDERWVDESHPQSNAALIRKRLLTGPAAAAHFIPFYREGGIDAAVTALSAELARLLPIDILVLGMGADMHTASLFPDADGLAEALAPGAPACAAITVPGQDVQRFTLTAPVLRGANSVHLLVKGEDKRAALNRAQGLPAAQAPVSCVLDAATVHWSAA
ncbi:6-phosphogluconolactonase [Sulfitobacter albidus]|uniref:6-phosphogluconolactonase n=1 Tax=Sulfitobacter albidus TaxID=2829501 RepID=A0A975JG11_9RHOB|nr:6-phosphogluconolactonase [Sulfitobacter albidus]QUJ77783.1 6-phosphogluconolactonase [Sulfitobacter albidus]